MMLPSEEAFFESKIGTAYSLCQRLAHAGHELFAQVQVKFKDLAIIMTRS